MENIIDYIKILYALAWADKKIQKEELNILHQIKDNFELTIEQQQIVGAWENSPITWNDLLEIDFNKFSLEQKKNILFLAISIVKSDGIATDDENKLLKDIQNSLDLSNISEDDLIKEIKDSQNLYGAE
jgi:tellurite resistance protein